MGYCDTQIIAFWDMCINTLLSTSALLLSRIWEAYVKRRPILIILRCVKSMSIVYVFDIGTYFNFDILKIQIF